MGTVDALRDGPKKYLMAGPEFNARFHDLADKWTTGVREMITSRKISDIESLADIYDITGDFKADFKTLLRNADESSKFFLKHLNKEKRESIISRLYKIHAQGAKILKDIKSSHPASSHETP
jgi:hypothetical protein